MRLGRINSSSETNETPDLIKLGIVNGKPCRLLIDTGADMTTVPSRLITPSQYTGKKVQAKLADGGLLSIPFYLAIFLQGYQAVL